MGEIIAQFPISLFKNVRSLVEAERLLNETIKKEGCLYLKQVYDALGFECDATNKYEAKECSFEVFGATDDWREGILYVIII